MDDGRHDGMRLPISGLVALALASFLLALACILFTREFGRVAAVWPSNALAVAVLLRRPLREWPGYAAAAILGCLSANLVVGDDPATASALAACNGLEILICSAIAWRFAGEPTDLTRSRHLLGFCIAAAIATAVSGVAASIVLAVSGHLPLWRTFLQWYVVDVLGLLIVTPALIGAVSGHRSLWALILSREAVGPSLALIDRKSVV